MLVHRFVRSAVDRALRAGAGTERPGGNASSSSIEAPVTRFLQASDDGPNFSASSLSSTAARSWPRLRPVPSRLSARCCCRRFPSSAHGDLSGSVSHVALGQCALAPTPRLQSRDRIQWEPE
jgi:hypothetical protein